MEWLKKNDDRQKEKEVIEQIIVPVVNVKNKKIKKDCLDISNLIDEV